MSYSTQSNLSGKKSALCAAGLDGPVSVPSCCHRTRLDGPWCSDFRMLCMYIDFVCVHYRRAGLPLVCAATGRGLDGPLV